MIIIEGVDGAGKTTLAAKMGDTLDLDVEHFGVPEGDPNQWYIDSMAGMKGPMVLDRFFHSEIPYSIVKRRRRYMKFLEFTMLELMAMTFPHLLIYCRPSRRVVNDRYVEEGDTYVDVAELNQLYDEYDELTMRSNLNMVQYDGESDPTSLIARAAKTLDPVEWAHRDLWQSRGMPGIGTLRPKYLFVGERYNPNAKYKVTFWSKSGEYLLLCLLDAGISLKDCHFTNAYSLILDPLSRAQIELLNPERVICLGEIAWNVVKPVMPPDAIVKRVPHPAYSSRFPWVPRSEYVSLLGAACGLGKPTAPTISS